VDYAEKMTLGVTHCWSTRWPDVCGLALAPDTIMEHMSGITEINAKLLIFFLSGVLARTSQYVAVFDHTLGHLVSRRKQSTKVFSRAPFQHIVLCNTLFETWILQRRRRNLV
jgi:hypothetical protein